jgi:hypothetical protein
MTTSIWEKTFCNHNYLLKINKQIIIQTNVQTIEMIGYDLIQCNMLLDILGNAYQSNEKPITLLIEALDIRYNDMTYIYGLLKSGGKNLQIGGLRNGFWASNQAINVIRNMNENHGFKLYLADKSYQKSKFSNLCKLRKNYMNKINQMGIENNQDSLNYAKFERWYNHAGEDYTNKNEPTENLHRKALEIWQQYYDTYKNIKNLLTARISKFDDIKIIVDKFSEPRTGSTTIGIILYKADIPAISIITTKNTKWVREIKGEWEKVENYQFYKTTKPSLMLTFDTKGKTNTYIKEQLPMELLLEYCEL